MQCTKKDMQGLKTHQESANSKQQCALVLLQRVAATADTVHSS